jgi:hypothetical protein
MESKSYNFREGAAPWAHELWSISVKKCMLFETTMIFNTMKI